ncbi:MAG TPA: hypothetical protein VLT62_22955 [Candidatus Methylomirabilis sp.]|nr:hypothetical protein [Candidatus Methylomirabilis sp.]
MKKMVISAIILATALVVGSAQTGHADGRRSGGRSFGSRSHGAVVPHRPFIRKDFGRHGVVGAHRPFFHSGFRHHPGFRTSVFIGPSLFWGPTWWGPAYPAYVEPPLVIQEAPPAYTQQPPAEQQPTYWYYCPNPAGYYPYVKQCPPGWLTVVPSTTPPPSASPPGSASPPPY